MRQLGLCTAPTHNIRRSAHSTMRSISCATTRTSHKGTYTKAKTKALHSAARCRQTAQQPRHNTASTQTHPQHSKRLKRSSTKHTVGAAATQSGTTPGWQSRLRRGHLRPRETLPSANTAPARQGPQPTKNFNNTTPTKCEQVRGSFILNSASNSVLLSKTRLQSQSYSAFSRTAFYFSQTLLVMQHSHTECSAAKTTLSHLRTPTLPQEDRPG